MSESSEVVGGGTSASAAATPDASAVLVLGSKCLEQLANHEHKLV